MGIKSGDLILCQVPSGLVLFSGSFYLPVGAVGLTLLFLHCGQGQGMFAGSTVPIPNVLVWFGCGNTHKKYHWHKWNCIKRWHYSPETCGICMETWLRCTFAKRSISNSSKSTGILSRGKKIIPELV